jgi:tetratricopeptide (TPR) repeat protein
MENKDAINDFQQFEKIEKYLLNEMTNGEKQEFEKEINQNKSLFAEVEQFRIVIQAIERDGMREKIGQFHAAIENDGSKDITKEKRIFTISSAIPYLVAASVLILVGIGLFRLISPSQKYKNIYSEFFQPDPGLITPMSARSDYVFYDGMIDYKRKDYESAISKWDSLKGQFAGSDTLNYFLGVAHLTIDNDEQAIEYLQTALQTPDNDFIHETRYYLGLAYLKQGNIDEAVKIFEQSEIAESKLILDRLNNQ